MFKKKPNSFKWPPELPSIKPKQVKHYKHDVTVASSVNAEYAYTLSFTSEKKARSFMRDALESTNNPLVEYERKEIPTVNDDGVIL
jgi:hypothetical protein